MRSIAVINQKGGVGKTTTTVNLGAALSRRGFRVLLMDMDPQANLTVHVDKRPDLESNTLTSLMVEDAPLSQVIQSTSSENLMVVPSDTSLAGVEQVLANRIGRETILRQALETFAEEQQFDFLLLDCPPSLGVLSANALVAAEHVVIPMQAEYLSLQGMAKLVEVIQLVQRQLNPKLEIALVLPCMVDSRTNLSAEVLSEIEQHFGGLLARTRIRNNVKLAEAPSFGLSIFEHAPDSNGAADYDSFACELLAVFDMAIPDVIEHDEEEEEAPAVHEEPTVQGDPAVPEAPAVQEDPTGPEVPTVQEDPTGPEAPAVQEDSAGPEAPTVQEDPAGQEDPTVPEDPAVQEAPAIQEDSAVQEDPTVQEAPATEDVDQTVAEVPPEPETVAADPAENSVKPEPPMTEQEDAGEVDGTGPVTKTPTPAVAPPPPAISDEAEASDSADASA